MQVNEMNSIANEFTKYGLAFDRSVNDVFSLPFTYDQIELQPNELAVANTLNIKLEKLYFNLLYLYKLCNVAGYSIPKTYSGWYGLTGTDTMRTSAFEFKLFSPAVPLINAVSFVSGGNQYASINDSVLALSYIAPSFDCPVLITASPTTLTIIPFSSQYTNTTIINGSPFVVTQRNIDPLSGSLEFNNITGLAIDAKEDILFVADQNLNNIYTYDITDTIFNRTRKFYLTNYIGGKGSSVDRTKFNSLNKIAYTGELLFAEDTGNKCIKVYDKNLNWLNTTVLKTLFESSGKFNAMSYNTRDNQLFACNDKSLYVMNITSDYTVLSAVSYDFSNIVLGSDRIVDLKFANYDSRIFYILTANNAIIKKWTTKPNSTIGISYQSGVSKWLTVVPNLSTDQILWYANSPLLSRGRILLYEDGLNLLSLQRDEDFFIYTLEDICINKDEYNQAWVYNKAFKKLLYNIILLNSNTGYRFFEGQTTTGLTTYVSKQYNTFFLTDTVLDVNTFANVCVNENFQGAVINRSLRKIYDYQSQILYSIINQENINTNLLPKTVTSNNVMFDFTVYYQGDGVTLKPSVFKAYSNTDGFVNSSGVSISNLAPYTSGSGIIII
jgi:hypothetical protein